LAQKAKTKKTSGNGKPKAAKVLRETRKDIQDSYTLPAGYDLTRLTLIARDPYWIHAYWELSSQDLDNLRQKMGAEFDRSALVLRMYDVCLIDFNGKNANNFFDLDVGFQARNWYINLWNDHLSFCGELGMRTPQGEFHPLTRSNTATTPRISFSGRDDLVWMEVKENQDRRPFVEPRPSVRRRRADPVQVASTRTNRRRRRYLTEDDIRAYYANLFPMLSKIRARKRLGRARARFRDKKGLSYEEIFLKGMTRTEFLKKILLGSSAEMVLRQGASERITEAFSGASEQRQQQNDFFFEIGTELIVYGRTEPDAEVMLGDSRVKLREDGTFTMRFALPEGNIPLNFVATKADKTHQRTISTSVIRTPTKYGL